MTNEALRRVKIDQLLKDTEWKLTDGRSVRFERPLDYAGKAEYVPFDRRCPHVRCSKPRAKSAIVSLNTRQRRAERAMLKELARSYNVVAATNSRLAA